MKKCKKERGGLFLLLIKNYIFLSLSVMIVGVIIYSIAITIFDKRSEFAAGLSDKDLKNLRQERFSKLDTKFIAGYSGIIEVLDENNDVIYSSDGVVGDKSYTKRQLNLIPYYGQCGIDTRLYKFYSKDSEEFKLLISTPYSFDDDGYLVYDSKNSWMKVLDESLNVVYEIGNSAEHSKSYTQEEVGYLIGEYPKDYTFMKYDYINDEGQIRTLIIKEKKVNDVNFYNNLEKIGIASLIIFFIGCIICIIIFGEILKRKVQKPLDKLNRAMQLLSEGKNNEPIVYSGPKEFVKICDSFNVMVNKLEGSEIERFKLIKDKQSMLADISHDLKTPVTTIHGYSKALVDGVIDEDDYKKYFNIIYSKSKRLTELINIFHEYSKLEHPDFKLVVENVDLAEYLRAYVAVKYEDILENGFDIEVDIPEKIMECRIDKIQFQRVLDNLLGNSIKHNTVGTKIYVNLSIVGEKYKIIIADNGLGISKEIRSNIFSPFIVGDESRNTKQGSGLGLAITKTIVEMHGGIIKLGKPLNNKYKTVFEIDLIY